MDEHRAVVAAAAELDVRPRMRRWAHLGLCVLDAVFSVGARYATTVRTCEQYARTEGLVALVDLNGSDPVEGRGAEQPLSVFVTRAAEAGPPERFAREVLRNRQLASTHSGVLKAEVAVRYAEILVDAGVYRFADVPALFADELLLDAVVGRLREVPGKCASDVRLGYLWMLLGDDHTINPDRMVLRWLEEALGRRPSVPEARALVTEAARTLDVTPWELGHAVWQAQRSQRPVVGSDSTTTRTYRAHQGRWRDEVLGLPAAASSNPIAQVRTVDSMLPTVYDGVRAEDAGWNLMSPAAVAYARARVPVVKAAQGVVEADRLWRNMLSSQPLAFSIVGELRAHPSAALESLSALCGVHLTGFDRVEAGGGPWVLDGLQAEWAPPRADHTGDRSGFDIAAAVRTEDGSRMLVTVEVKYTDAFSRAPLDPGVYAVALRDVGIDGDTAARLVAAGASQFLRSVLLTDSVRRGGRSGAEPLDGSLAVVLSRDDDRSAAAAVRRLAEAQTVVPVGWWGLGAFLDAAGGIAELADWADAMRARYLPDDDMPAPIR